MDKNEMITPFDEAINSRELQMLKTILPYVPLAKQRQLVLVIEMLQMQSTLNYLDSANNLLAAQDIPEETDNRVAMLSAIKRFCTPKDQDTIDNIINVLSIMNNQI
ncbi:MAG: hypothetical protein U0K86_12505 [Agathobacter sp.]|nr:hypothetical protein [Agathobacter sp.]